VSSRLSGAARFLERVGGDGVGVPEFGGHAGGREGDVEAALGEPLDLERGLARQCREPRFGRKIR
jgi:hypothetical protein